MEQKKIHVVHIIPTLTFGGAERHVVDLVNALDPKEFYLTIIVLKDDVPLARQITTPGVDVILVKKKGKLSLGLTLQLEGVLRTLAPDVVHTHLFGGDFWGRRAANKLDIPVVTTEHNINEDEGWLKRCIKRYMRHKSVFYLAPSKAVAALLRSVYRVNKPIQVTPYGIDLSLYESLVRPMFTDEVRFLILGRLTEQKGQDVALRAFAQLPSHRSYTLEIVGAGEDEQMLRDLVVELDLQSSVKFLPPQHNIPELLEGTDILLVPSRWEGLGIVVMEGMAAGRLVIGSNVGGIPELVQDKKTGLLVQPEDERALVHTIENILDNPHKAQGIASAGQEYARRHFSVEKAAEEIANVYKQIVVNN